MTSRNDAQFADYITARLPALRRLAFLRRTADLVFSRAKVAVFVDGWARLGMAARPDPRPVPR